MKKKRHIGRKASSFELYDELGPITGVVLLLDDNNEIVAGSEDGYVLQIDCKYGTQTMADNILAAIVGRTYKGFRAAGTLLDPMAELGDGITVVDTYSILAYRSVNFGPGHMSEIAAPGESTLEHEYQYKSPTQRQTDRKLAQTRSLISKTAEEITLLVEKEIAGLGDQFTELKVTLDGVTVTDANGTTLIKGSSIETDTLYVDAAHISGKLVANQIDATDLVLTNSANIANNFIVDQYGNVTINGNINFSGGSITWGANDPADGSGISASEARTIISEQLVSSPNIAGGKFWNLDMDTWVEVGDDDEHYGLTVNNNYWGILFGVYDGDMAYTSFCAKLEYYFLLVDGDSQKSFPRGTWDFSGATVTGLDISSTATAVFG